MDLQAAQARLAALEADPTLDHEDNLRGRLAALYVVAEITDYAFWRPASEGWPSLLPRAEALKQRLDAANEKFFHTLRANIRSGRSSPLDLRRLFNTYTDYTPAHTSQALSGPDRLDVLLDGLLGITGPVARKNPLPLDTNPYEPAPARVGLNLVDLAGWQTHDVFFDIGSGLGRIVILFHLLTGQPARGVEIDPGLCEQARQSTRRLNLTQVEFIEADAREADYSGATMFFLFTPFKASVWRAVLDKLRHESQQRKLKLCTFGPCTRAAAQELWLTSLNANTQHTYKVALFESR